jgi:hypothetical protein
VGRVKELLSHHLEALHASAITDDTIALRGYWSARKAVELERLGYRRNTVSLPALVLPTRDVRGEIIGYQVRPDVAPVIGGRIAKYLSPPGAEIRLDIPPACRTLIGSPVTALWVVEGTKKGDSLASHGLTVVAVMGVQMFRTDDWDQVPLDGRRVFVAYDSDVMVKPAVDAALRALRDYLAARGAELAFCYLPTDNGKVGVDDFLANGGKVEDLYALAETELRDPPSEPEPKRDPALPTAQLLAVIEKLLGRFVRFPSGHEPVALALFTLHTYALDAATSTPYILVISPEKRSGKTRILEVIELVVREPLRAANITAAGTFQAIEAWVPTLLVDEVDAVFVAKSEHAEALRGVLNAGNRRGSYVVRGTQDGTPAKFGTFCCKVLSGIDNNRMPDTIADRAICLRMQRKRPEEAVEDLFPDELADQLAELRRRLSHWASENINTLAGWRRPARVEGLDDRLQEAWDPLLAISDLAHAGWPEKARAAATALAKGAEDASDAAHGHLLIEALRSIFGDKPAMSSQAICDKLNADEELPFGSYTHGTGIKPRDLARLLKPYGIKPKVVRLGAQTPRGYERKDFAETWRRYAHMDGDGPGADEKTARHADPSEKAQRAQHPQHPSAKEGFDPQHDLQHQRNAGPDVADQGPDVAERVARENPDGTGDVADVADVAAPRDHSCAEQFSTNGAGPDRTIAELADGELPALFPGATIEHGPEISSEASPCACHQRKCEWRLGGEALDITATYVSGKAHRKARGAGRPIVPKGKQSGWAVEWSSSGHGHQWMCGLCHAPANGLDVEWRGAEPEREAPAS